MKVAVVFDSPYEGFEHSDHEERMVLETSPGFETEAEPEYQVARALRDRGHEVYLLGAYQDPRYVTDFLRDNPVDMAFNVAEGFAFEDNLDYLLPAILEAEGHPYTGASPQALMVTRNKAMTKKILSHHNVKVPRFDSFRVGETAPGSVEFNFPVIVKPLRSDGSEGISKASVVYDANGLRDRVAFIHNRYNDGAIVEEYINGRELYVSVLGNGKNVRLLPTIELVFDKDCTRPEDRIVTRTSKWNMNSKAFPKQVFARRMSAAAEERIKETCLSAYEALWLRDYARFDLRLDDDDNVWVLEANANPYISKGHEAAKAAEKAGMDYGAFIEKIIRVAARRYR